MQGCGLRHRPLRHNQLSLSLYGREDEARMPTAHTHSLSRLVRACGGSVANSMEACLTSFGLRNVGSPPTWASQRRSDSPYSPYARATRLKTGFEEVLTHDWAHSALTRGEFRGDARRIMFLKKQHVFSESDDVRCRESVSWRALSNHPPKKKCLFQKAML